MDADWITSPSARRVLQHADDLRPAWLWSHDGQLLIWQNGAAELFLAKLKKSGLKQAPLAIPIKGQVPRNIRMGSLGRTSLARIQFMSGSKPASSTCATTPLSWQDGQTVLLIVGVDPIDAEIVAAATQERMGDETASEGVNQQPEADFESSPASDGESVVAEQDAPESADATPVEPVAEPTPDAAALEAWAAVEEPSLPEAEAVEPAATMTEDEQIAADDTAFERELEGWRDPEQGLRPTLVAVSDDRTQDGDGDDAQDDEPPAAEPEAQAGTSRLSRLVERLASDEALYAPLTADDDVLASQPQEPLASEAPVEDDEAPAELTEAEADLDDLRALDGTPDAPLPDADDAQDGSIVDEDDGATNIQSIADAIAAGAAKAADPEIVERVSRYNFDELSRILTDRVGEAAQPSPVAPTSSSEPQRTGALINLGGETLVLNRLPLGILVFRDQQVLFANRAVTEMVGYDSVEQLREAGLAAIFPAAGPDGQDAGPVNHLVQRDGTLVPVTARLQSISWQGRPALMLSASTTEVRTGHEAAVNAFARTLADLRGDGFLEATRSGVISAITPNGAELLGHDRQLEGKPLSNLVAGSEVPTLREFLDRPARFAETSRPCQIMRASSGTADILLFAQGQAGVITGYFGFIRSRNAAPLRISSPDGDPALLGRISRGLRRPLNTILGFAEMVRTIAPPGADNEKLDGYARDIGTAGQEIAALVDELEDYARLRDGRYLPQRANVELTALLETCVLRIRQQASSARVFVRNAISETLPRVTADRASLAQAVLNLLASAIDQTPTGGAVVISAQLEDDGGISIHVRDSSINAVDMAERFVVFRDGLGRDGQLQVPVRSSVGLALTRSLLAVNAFSLSVDPAGEQGMLFTLMIPADLVDRPTTQDVAPQ